ncbi:hypothetical protein [Pedobacter sp. Leaf176]|uniref:hypothetical protein n=1 Tax=unclassified Pedobacter TaxID=2628915 RepID=UPI0006FC646D|nr:hypothetical protein [Pedobacter sp. Leaf176]KQR68375.1 hypothetical protein ASF92_16060 [Pedobacter sp. Leaf176]
MAIEIVKATFGKAKPKATIHLTGKLGFNMEANNLMGLKAEEEFLFAKDTDDKNVFYLISGNGQEGAGKVAKAGDYYYLNLGDVFDTVGLDYVKEIISFDIKKDTHDGNVMYILGKRKSTIRSKKENKEEETN